MICKKWLEVVVYFEIVLFDKILATNTKVSQISWFRGWWLEKFTIKNTQNP
jgi:hypothetical protein